MSLRRLLIVLACLVVSGVSLFLAASVTGQKQPEVGLEPSDIDVGRVAQETPVRIEMRFRNGSGSPVVIDQVVASCGCTVAEVGRREVLPGKSVPIAVTWDLRGRRYGNHVTGVLRYRTTGRTDEVPFRLRADVLPSFTWEPERVAFHGDESGPVRLIVRRGPGWKSGEVRRAETTHDSLEARLTESDGETAIELTRHPDREVAGHTKPHVVLHTGSPGESILSIPVYIE